MDVHGFTVGPVAENCFFAARDGATQAIVIDPGDEGDRLIAALDELGLSVEAILLTHTHFDHVGAVAPLARHTGAPVYCPELEKHVLADIMSYVPWAGFGPFESYDADELVSGGERLELAGLEIDVLFTPGHSPGHVTYSIPAEQAVFCGDVLFQGSIGRTDLPGGDTATLMRTLGELRRRAARRDGRLPRPHGRHDDRERAGHEPVPARDLAQPVSPRIQAPRGTFDVLGDDALARDALEEHARRILEGAGYARIETPAFEATELFARGVGESTDVVQKEMYTIDEGPSESLTLRPEGTAPVCRAYLEHGMHKLPQPVKLWYLSSFFRRERPQAGRFRQFWQVGAEAIGSADPAVDAELILLLSELLGDARRARAAAAPVEPRHAGDARAVPRRAPGLPARARGRAVRRGARRASTSTRCAPSTPTIPARAG